MSSTTTSCLGLSLMLLLNGVASTTTFSFYKTALTNSLLYYEAQRSGRLPPNQRVQWRGDSGLKDGSDAHMSLVGGYYDSGDNVKFGFPMAFTVTMLSWSVVEFQSQLAAKGELSHALDAIKWGTDYLIKAHRYPHVLYGEVGEGTSDHNCWERPEDMTTPRTTFRIDNQHPGADLAGETAAAFAAASMAFRRLNPRYASQLLIRAKQLFNFAHTHPGLYQNSIPVAGAFYSSSGYQDELLWAAAWLHRATSARNYLYYLGRSNNTGGTRSMFSWDDKYIGAQVLVAKLVLEGKVKNNGVWEEYKSEAEQFICSCIQKGNSNVQKTPGGMLWFQQPWNPLQYTSSASFILSAYADYLTAARTNLQCQHGLARPTDLITFARSQVNYILGANPKRTSYMVGFGSRYPQQVHHRGSSIVSIKKNRTVVTCNEGYALWYSRDAPNPNLLVGAVVGGPDQNDNYVDARTNYQQGEPSTVTTAPLVGVLARLA